MKRKEIISLLIIASILGFGAVAFAKPYFRVKTVIIPADAEACYSINDKGQVTGSCRIALKELMENGILSEEDRRKISPIFLYDPERGIVFPHKVGILRLKEREWDEEGPDVFVLREIRGYIWPLVTSINNQSQVLCEGFLWPKSRGDPAPYCVGYYDFNKDEFIPISFLGEYSQFKKRTYSAFPFFKRIYSFKWQMVDINDKGMVLCRGVMLRLIKEHSLETDALLWKKKGDLVPEVALIKSPPDSFTPYYRKDIEKYKDLKFHYRIGEKKRHDAILPRALNNKGVCLINVYNNRYAGKPRVKYEYSDKKFFGERGNVSCACYLWKDGKYILQVKNTLGDRRYIQGIDINDKNEITGVARIDADVEKLNYRAFLWSNGKLVNLGIPENSGSSFWKRGGRKNFSGKLKEILNEKYKTCWKFARTIGLAINNKTEIVGVLLGNTFQPGDAMPWMEGRRFQIIDCMGRGGIHEPFYWKKGKNYALQSLLPSDTNWWLIDAFDINNRSEIVCSAVLQGELPSSLAEYLSEVKDKKMVLILEPVEREVLEKENPPQIVDWKSFLKGEIAKIKDLAKQLEEEKKRKRRRWRRK